jgi:group II intron reverse transcriptase/maturase/CRISPR-associated endonuclease Cas1
MEMTTSNNLALTYANLCSPVCLREAWEKVEAKRSAGGIDQMSVQAFKEDADRYLDDLLEELTERTYVPEPYLTIHIPKDENEQRRLGLLSVKDKIVQQAVLDLIHPVLDAHFLDCSYGYRRKKGPVRAVRRVWHAIRHEGNKWLIKLDLDNFFDNIPHEPLFRRLRRFVPDDDLLQLIALCIRMGRVDRSLEWTDNDKGTPQGALLSPIMANLYLHDLDLYITSLNVGYVRYADDFLILTKDERAARKVFVKIKQFLDQKMRLPLNPDPRIAPLRKGIAFLGITFYESHYGLSKEKMISLREKIREPLNLKKGSLPLEFIQTLDGIRRYYGEVLYESTLIPLDEYLQQLLKAELERHKKIFRTQKSVRKALSPLNFLTDAFNRKKKEIIDELSGKKGLISSSDEISVSTDLLIQRRKRQYEQMQSAGMELLISQRGLSVSLSRRGITVKKRGKNILTAPTANVRHISIISKGVVISSNLIEYCARKDIPIDFFNRKGKPIARIYDPDTTDDKLWLAQLNARKNGKGIALCKAIVLAKIKNQANLLKYYGKYRKKKGDQFGDALPDVLTKLERVINSIEQLPETELAALRLSLFGKEGYAGQLYWSMIKILLEGKVKFSGRERKGAKDKVNVMLNYGYGILYSRLWDAVLKARLNPYISFLHVRQAGKPTLTFDLIEEFRQVAVDKIVFAMLSKREEVNVKDGQLSEESRKKLAGKILTNLNEVETFRGKDIRLSQIIKEQSQRLGHFLTAETTQYKPYRLKW